MALFDELVPPEVRPAFRRACELLRGLDEGLGWAASVGVCSNMLADLEVRLRTQHSRDRADVAEMLAAYRRRDVTSDAFARWVETHLEPDRILERAGIASRSSLPPAP